MAHKTKAAMPDRQCNNTKHIQHTRGVAGEQIRTIQCSLSNLPKSGEINFPQWGKPPFSGQRLSSQEIRGTAPLARFAEVMNEGSVGCSPLAYTLHWRKYQPFGSIPCRRNSARANSFIQLPKLTPSRSAASFNCWRSSGLILIWKVGDQPSPLGVLSRFIVDTYVRNLLTWILLCTYVNTSGIEKTTPQTVGAVLGRLTKSVIRSNDHG